VTATNLINPAAVAAMAEIGIDISAEFPKPWTDEIVRAADVVVTMGCGDACPIFPGKSYQDWDVPDPAGQPIEAVRPIRDQIGQRVRNLLQELDGTDAPTRTITTSAPFHSNRVGTTRGVRSGATNAGRAGIDERTRRRPRSSRAPEPLHDRGAVGATCPKAKDSAGWADL
jgi:hypothetical protein